MTQVNVLRFFHGILSKICGKIHIFKWILIMRYPYRQIKLFTILLLAVKFISPLYGQVYFSELLNAVESSHTEYVCVQKGGGASHESQESPQHIIQCHELEQPGLIASDLIIHYSPAISTLASSEKDAILLGYRFPIKIPPKNHV